MTDVSMNELVASLNNASALQTLIRLITDAPACAARLAELQRAAAELDQKRAAFEELTMTKQPTVKR